MPVFYYNIHPYTRLRMHSTMKLLTALSIFILAISVYATPVVPSPFRRVQSTLSMDSQQSTQSSSKSFASAKTFSSMKSVLAPLNPRNHRSIRQVALDKVREKKQESFLTRPVWVSIEEALTKKRELRDERNLNLYSPQSSRSPTRK